MTLTADRARRTDRFHRRVGAYLLRRRRLLPPSTHAIVIEASHAPNRQVKTLVHELAHALVRADRQDDDPQLDRAAEELVAETIAYSVCASSGIDAGEFSISYPAGWSEQTPVTTIERTAR